MKAFAVTGQAAELQSVPSQRRVPLERECNCAGRPVKVNGLARRCGVITQIHRPRVHFQLQTMLLRASASRACSLLRNTGTCPAHVAPPALSYSPSRAFAHAATRDVSARAQETGTTMLTPGCDLTKASCQGKCDK